MVSVRKSISRVREPARTTSFLDTGAIVRIGRCANERSANPIYKIDGVLQKYIRIILEDSKLWKIINDIIPK
mgnify:CR=1 FL=1